MPNNPNIRTLMVPLRTGEIDLIRRALRYYAHAERDAIQLAAKQGNALHAADVRRQCLPRVAAAEELTNRLLHDPTLQKGRGK